jgi:hypothetical protein
MVLVKLVKRKLVLVYLETILISTQDRCMVYTKRTIGSEIILGGTGWNSYVMQVKWKLVSVHLKIVLISTHDRCTVCAKCTIGSEIILGATDGTT